MPPRGRPRNPAPPRESDRGSSGGDSAVSVVSRLSDAEEAVPHAHHSSRSTSHHALAAAAAERAPPRVKLSPPPAQSGARRRGSPRHVTACTPSPPTSPTGHQSPQRSPNAGENDSAAAATSQGQVRKPGTSSPSPGSALAASLQQQRRKQQVLPHNKAPSGDRGGASVAFQTPPTSRGGHHSGTSSRGGRGRSRSSHSIPVINPSSAGGLAPPIPPVPAQRLPPSLKPKKSSSRSPALGPSRPPKTASPLRATAVSSQRASSAAAAAAPPPRAFQRLPSGKGGVALAMLPPSQQGRRAKSGGGKTPRPNPSAHTGIARAAAAAAAAKRIGEGIASDTSEEGETGHRRAGGAGRDTDGSSVDGVGNRTPTGSSPPPSARGGPGAYHSRGRQEGGGTSTNGGGAGAASFAVLWVHFKESCAKQSWLSSFLAWSYHLVHVALALALLFSPMLMRSTIFSQVTMSRTLLQAQGLAKPTNNNNNGPKTDAPLDAPPTPSPRIAVTVESIWSIHDAVFFSRPGETVIEAPISESFTKLHDGGGGGGNHKRKNNKNSNDGGGDRANTNAPTISAPPAKRPDDAQDGNSKNKHDNDDDNDQGGNVHSFVAKKAKKSAGQVYQLVSPVPLPNRNADEKDKEAKFRNRKKAVSGRTTLGKIVEAWEASPLYSSPLALALYYYLYVVGSALLLMIGTEGRLTGHFSLLRMTIGSAEMLWFVHHGGHSFLIFLWSAVLSRWPRKGLDEQERHFLNKGTPYATVNRVTGEVQFRWFYHVSRKDGAQGMNGTPYVDGVLDMQKYLYDPAAYLVIGANIIAFGFLACVVACVLKDALRVLEAIMGVRPLCEPEGYIRCPLCGDLIEPCDIGALTSAAERRRRLRRRRRRHRHSEKQKEHGLVHRVLMGARSWFQRGEEARNRAGYTAIPTPAEAAAAKEKVKKTRTSEGALSPEPSLATSAGGGGGTSSSVYDTDISFYEGRTAALTLPLSALSSSSRGASSSSSSSSSSSEGSASSTEATSSTGSEEVESSEEDENEGGIVKVIVAPTAAGSPTSSTGGGGNPKGHTLPTTETQRKRSNRGGEAAVRDTARTRQNEEDESQRESEAESHNTSDSLSRHRHPQRRHHRHHDGRKGRYGEKLYLSHATRHVHHRCPKLYLDAESASDEDDDEVSDTNDDEEEEEETDTDASRGATAPSHRTGSSGTGSSAEDAAADGGGGPSGRAKGGHGRHAQGRRQRHAAGRHAVPKAGGFALTRRIGDGSSDDMRRNRSMSPRRRIVPTNAEAAAVVPVFAQPTPSTLMRPSSPEEGPDGEELVLEKGHHHRLGLARSPTSSRSATDVAAKKVLSAHALDTLAMNYSFAGPMDGYGATLDRPYSQRLYPDGTPIPVGGVGAVGESDASPHLAHPYVGGGHLGPGLGARPTVGDHYVSRAVYDPFKDGEDEFRPGNAFPSYERAGWYSRLTYNWLNPLVGFAVLEPTLLRNDRFLPSLPEYLTSLENTAVPVRWLWVNRRTWFASMVAKPGAIIPTEEALDVAEEMVLQLADLRENSEDEESEEEEETESSEGQAMVVLGKRPLTNARFRAQRPKKEMEERLLLTVTWPLRKVFAAFFYSFYIGSSHTIARTHKRLMRALLKDRLAAAAALGELGYGEQLETTYALAEMASSEDTTEHGSVGSVLPIHMRRQLALSDVSLFYIFLEQRAGRRFVYAAGALLLVQNIFMFSIVPLIATLIHIITPRVISPEEAAAALAAASAARQGSVGGGLSYGTTTNDDGSLTTTVDVSAGLLCCLGIAAALMVQNVAYQCYWSQVSEAAMEAKTAVRTLVLDKVMALPLAQRTFSDEEVVGLVQTEALRVSACMTTLHHTWSNPLCLVVAVMMLWHYIGWMPALVVLVEVMLLVPAMRHATAAIRQRQREAPSGFERRTLLMEALMNMRTVKAMLAESTYARILRQMRAEEGAASKAVSRATARFVAVAEAGMLTLVVSFFVACYWTSRAEHGGKRKAEDPETVFSAAAVIPCMVVLTLMWNPITEFPALFHSVARGYLSMKRIEAFLRQSPDEFVGTWVDLTTAREQSVGYGRGSVICRGCSFTWQHDLTQEVPQPQLINVNMDILPGELVVVQGSVGAGKSTLLLAVLGEINRCVDLDDRSDAASPFLYGNLSSSESFEVDSAAAMSGNDDGASSVGGGGGVGAAPGETTALLSVMGRGGGGAASSTASSGTYGALGSVLAAAVGRVSSPTGAAKTPARASNETSVTSSHVNAKRVQTHRPIPHSPQSLASLATNENSDSNHHLVAGGGASGFGAAESEMEGDTRPGSGDCDSDGSGNASPNRARARTEGFLVFGSIAYCSEEPWLQNDTIRANIMVGGSPSQVRWYRHVVRACALEEDFRRLPLGDKTVIGEKGAALTTSQKVRIALARALYTKSDIYLFDSILTWLDEKTRAHIVKEVFHTLLRDKTVIVATNVGLSALRPHRIFTVQEEGLVREDTHLYKEASATDEESVVDSAEDSGYEAQREERRPVRGPNLTAAFVASRGDNGDDDAHHHNHPLPTLYAEEFEEPVAVDSDGDVEDADDESDLSRDQDDGEYLDEDDIAADELFEDGEADGSAWGRRSSADTDSEDTDGDYSHRSSDSGTGSTTSNSPSDDDSDDGGSEDVTSTGGDSEEGEVDDRRSSVSETDSSVSLVTTEEGTGDRRHARSRRKDRHRHRRRRHGRRGRHGVSDKKRKGRRPGTAKAAKDKKKKKKNRRLRKKRKEEERRRKVRQERRRRGDGAPDEDDGSEAATASLLNDSAKVDADHNRSSDSGSSSSDNPSHHRHPHRRGHHPHRHHHHHSSSRHRDRQVSDEEDDDRTSARTRTPSSDSVSGQRRRRHSSRPAGDDGAEEDSPRRRHSRNGSSDTHESARRPSRDSSAARSRSSSSATSSTSTSTSSTHTTTAHDEGSEARKRRRSHKGRKRRSATIKKSRIPDTGRAIHIFIGFMGKQAWWLLLACLLQQLLRLGVDVWVGLWLVQPDWLPDALSNVNFLEILGVMAVLTVAVVPIRGSLFFSGVSGTLSLVYQLAMERVFRSPVTFFMEKTKTATTVLRILTKDIEMAEHSLPESIDIILSAVMQLAAVALFNSLLNPCFVLVLPMAVVLFTELTERYVIMIRELRRLENRSVSGTVALLRESLDGAPMVRCYALQDRIREEYCRTIDITNAAGMVAYMTERWVGLRLYCISILLITSVAVLGVLFASSWMAPGLTGVALVLCLRTARIFTALCRRVAHFHVEWSSVRRLLTLLLRVPTEALTAKGNARLRTYVQLRRPCGQQAEFEDMDAAPLVHLVRDKTGSGVPPNALSAVAPEVLPNQSKANRELEEGADVRSPPAPSSSSSSSSSAFSGSPMTLPVLEMVNVTARYGRAQSAALNRMNLVVYPGERVGLVGKSGQGKTSVFHVLLRLVDTVESGGLYINGEDAQRVPYPILRSWFAVIPQSPVIVSGTWRDNLLVGYRPSSLLFQQWQGARRQGMRTGGGGGLGDTGVFSVASDDGADVAQIGEEETGSSEEEEEDGDDDRVFAPGAAAGRAAYRPRRRRSELVSDDEERGNGSGSRRGRTSRSTFLNQAALNATGGGYADGTGAKAVRRKRRNSQRQDRSISAPPGRQPGGLESEAEDHALWRALRLVGLAYLCEMDGGLDSPVTGTGGGALSESMGLLASQRQLLCLARAVLHRPPFILLEDATSPMSGDSVSDQLIRQVLAEELRDSTVIVIVHRYATVRSFCTRVVAMKEGTVTPITEPAPAPPPASASGSGSLNSPTVVGTGSALPSAKALAPFIE